MFNCNTKEDNQPPNKKTRNYVCTCSKQSAGKRYVFLLPSNHPPTHNQGLFTWLWLSIKPMTQAKVSHQDLPIWFSIYFYGCKI